jgi:hypothetical protein
LTTDLASKIVAEARTWRNTRFQHQGNIKGIGVDCVNFISEVAKGAGIEGIDIPQNYRPHEDGTVMLQLLREHMELVSEGDMQPGDVLALCDVAGREPDVPRHLVIVSNVTPKTVFIIHASEAGVREHRTDSSWLRRVHSVWRIKA